MPTKSPRNKALWDSRVNSWKWLAPFEDSNIGAVGNRQRVRRRPGLGIIDQIWQYLRECYIERRNFEISATSDIDGKISCLSGRTAAVRTEILQTEDFMIGYRGKAIVTAALQTLLQGGCCRTTFGVLILLRSSSRSVPKSNKHQCVNAFDCTPVNGIDTMQLVVSNKSQHRVLGKDASKFEKGRGGAVGKGVARTYTTNFLHLNNILISRSFRSMRNKVIYFVSKRFIYHFIQEKR